MSLIRTHTIRWRALIALVVAGIIGGAGWLIVNSRWWHSNVGSISDVRIVIKLPDLQPGKPLISKKASIRGRTLLARSEADAERLEAKFRKISGITDPSQPKADSQAEQEESAREEPIRTEVELLVNDVEVGRQSTDDQGNFIFETEHLRSGRNSVAVVASVTLRWRRVSARESQLVDVRVGPNRLHSMNEVPRIVGQRKLEIAGFADPETRVRVNLSEEATSGAKASKVVTSGWDGRFHTTLEIDKPGEYVVTAQTDRGDLLSDTDQQVARFKYDPDRSQSTTETLSRAVTATISYKKLHLDLKARFEKDDPLVADLISGKTSNETFVLRAFNFLRVNDEYVTGMFDGQQPEITYDSAGLSFSMSSNPAKERAYYLPTLSGSISFYDFLPRDRAWPDTFAIAMQDYTVGQRTPESDSAVGNVYTWNTTNFNHESGSTSMQVQVSYHPFRSARDFIRLFSLSPLELFNYPERAALGLLFAVWGALPMLWLLASYSWRKHTDRIDTPLLTQIRSWARWLFALALTPALQSQIFVQYATVSLRLPLFWRFEVREHLYLALFSIGFFAAFLFYAFLLRQLHSLSLGATGRAILRGLSITFRGLQDAALVCIFVNVSMVVLTYLSSETSVYQPFIALIAVPLLWPLYLWPKRLRALPNTQFKIPRFVQISGVLTWLIMAWPIHWGIQSQEPYRDYLPVAYKLAFWPIMQQIAPSLLLPALVLLLNQASRNDTLSRRSVRLLGSLIFAGYLVGTTPTLLGIPISFFLALWVLPRFAFEPFSKWRHIDGVATEVLPRRGILLKQTLAGNVSDSFRQALDQLAKKVVAGDLAPHEYEARKKEIEEHIAWGEHDGDLAGGLKVKSVVAALGPFESNWANGIWAVKHAWLLTLPLAVFYLVGITQRESWTDNPYPILWVSSRLFTFLLSWLAAGFFFGYFFAYIRGDSGLKKGVRISLAVIASLLPSWLGAASAIPDLIGILLHAAEYFLFFTVIGIWTFDYKMFRKSLKEQYTWRKFVQFEELPSLTALSSVLVTSVGVAVTSVLKGWLPALLALALGTGGPDQASQHDQRLADRPPINRGVGPRNAP